MRVFVTGASGHLGWAVVPELLRAGHEVVGLARSETSAATVKSLGAEVRHGDLGDLDGLLEAAADADAVVHLAFDHETMRTDFPAAAAADLAVVRAFGDALAGTGKAFIGIGATPVGSDAIDRAIGANPRSVASREVAGMAERGIRSMLVAVPPVVHSTRDTGGFVPALIRIARDTGVSGYVGEGANRWPAGHALDIGRLYRLALEKAPAGTQLIGATEPGIEVRRIAETIGRHLGVPAVSMPAEQAAGHFRAFPFITLDIPSYDASGQEFLGWQPEHPGLIADLDEGHYFTTE